VRRFALGTDNSVRPCAGGILPFSCGPDNRFNVSAIERDHIAQTFNALRATGLEVGLILNFGPKAQIKRVIFTRKDEAPVQP